jgi:transcriptional regulator with XRE-family HTH domain
MGNKVLDIGNRITEVFGQRQISEIVALLKCDRKEITSVINGRSLPTTERLLSIHEVTGASIDWLLTGEGRKYQTGPRITDQSTEMVSPAMWFAGEERERTGQLL